eukprot:GDKI01048156.1.p1 GENE.GDKI01048156.1~~GDKI01048156.1.p1  ORF type:complete len:641 (-),score=128.77 GDKI01048156.1:266-2188(-)
MGGGGNYGCVDRNQDEVNGHFARSVQDFDGKNVYAELLYVFDNSLIKRTHDIQNTQEWVDLQTTSIRILNTFFTPGRSVGTLMDVQFSVQPEGIRGTYKLKSFHKMDDASMLAYTGLLATVLVLSCAQTLFAFYSYFRKRPVKLLADSLSTLVFDTLLRIALMVYCGSRLIDRHTVNDAFFDEYFMSVVDVKWSDPALTFENKFTELFGSVSTALNAMSVESEYESFAYFLIYLLFFRLIGYFCAHPRISHLVAAFQHALDDLGHYAVNFLLVFVFLSFLGYFMLGPTYPEYQTMTYSFYRHMRSMLTMDVDYVFPVPSAFFLLHHATYYVMIVYVLMNLFLAIIVGSFSSVKNSNKGARVDMNLFVDVVMLIKCGVCNVIYGWPRREVMLGELIREWQAGEKWISPEHYATLACFKNRHTACAESMFSFYFSHFPVLSDEDEKETEKETDNKQLPESSQEMTFKSVFFNDLPFTLPPIPLDNKRFSVQPLYDNTRTSQNEEQHPHVIPLEHEQEHKQKVSVEHVQKSGKASGRTITMGINSGAVAASAVSVSSVLGVRKSCLSTGGRRQVVKQTGGGDSGRGSGHGDMLQLVDELQMLLKELQQTQREISPCEDKTDTWPSSDGIGSNGSDLQLHTEDL